MGLFVAVERACEAPESDLAWTFEIRSYRSSGDLMVADYTLVDLATGDDIAAIHEYSRCTETGLTLFHRMLKRSRGRVLAERAVGCLTIAVQDGGGPSRALVREVLRIQVREAHLEVDLLSPAALVAKRRISTRDNLCVRDAICLSMGAALGWGESLPSFPIPLSAVPVRRGIAGNEYVNLSDVPAIPRQYLRRRFCLSDRTKTLQASLWRGFLGLCANMPPEADPGQGDIGAELTRIPMGATANKA